MLKNLSREQASANLFYFSCLLAVTGLPLSVFLMSISVFVMAGAWLLQPNLKSQFRKFTRNKIALLLCSLFLLHVLGLLWSSNLNYGLNDLRVKLPILLFPLFLSSGPSLTKKQVQTILEVFVAAVTVSVIISFVAYAGVLKKEIKDIRDISLFISHIRLSLMICIALVYHGSRFIESDIRVKLYRIISSLLMLGFLFLTGSVTGIILLIGVIAVLILIKLSTVSRALQLGLILLILLVIGGSAAYITKEVQNFYAFSQEETIEDLEPYTIQGNPYFHDTSNTDMENGRRVYLYISWPELEREWENKSSWEFHGKDKKGQELKYTLVRYMTALGLRKDKQGFDKLSDEDIKNVESGITNPLYKNFGMKARIHQVIWELDHYKRGNDPSGHSVSMRLEFWKNAFAVFEDHPVTGVGTGDVKDELHSMYEARKSSLQERWRLRAHNQYLTFALTFGVIGLLWFLISLLAPLFDKPSALYLAFFVIAAGSMLTEDTLETQAGGTFYAFFNAFLLFIYDPVMGSRSKEVISEA